MDLAERIVASFVALTVLTALQVIIQLSFLLRDRPVVGRWFYVASAMLFAAGWLSLVKRRQQAKRFLEAARKM